jgi:uncharacterized membrane protein
LEPVVKTALASEIRKVTSLKFWWILLICATAFGVLAALLGVGVSGLWSELTGGYSASAQGATNASMIGASVALVGVCFFAAIFAAVNGGTEQRHETLSATFAITPRRDIVIASKLLVTLAVAAVYTVVVEAVWFVARIVVGGSQFATSGQLAGLLALGLVAALAWSVIGLGVGMASGSSMIGVVALAVWFIVGEWIAQLAIYAVVDSLAVIQLTQFLPDTATAGFLTHFFQGDTEAFAQSALALIAWVAVFAGFGWWRLRTKDVT